METSDDSRKGVKRKFVSAWLSDDRYKPWIRQVSTNNTVYFCTICNKTFSCSSPVSKHVDSPCHKKNIKENVNDNDEDINETFRKTTKFRQQWLDVKEFKPWLCEVPNNKSLALCTFCNKTFTCGRSQICRHAESQMHREKESEKSIETHKLNTNLNMQHDESRLSFDERKKSLEIRFAALIAENNISHQTANVILKFFQEIDDFNLVKNISMSRTKCHKIISNVLCPVETERVVNNIQNTKFTIFIDETSDLTNEKWMTFFVRYVDSESLDVRSQLVKLIDIDARDCSAEKLFNAFQSKMHKLQIPFTNILALSCDNASVMTGKYVSFKTKLEKKSKNLLTFACPCHSAALAAHAACAKLPAFCHELLKKIVNYINSSPKRSAIFKEFCECFQNTNRKLLKLCDTRWLSHYTCTDRILESWDTIKHFLNEIIVSEKTKSAENILSLMNNIDTKAYFLFLKYVLNLFNSFNAFFQAHETRIHLLNSKSVDFLLQICKNFLKPEALNLLTNITFSEQINHKAINDINLGLDCEKYLHDLAKQGHADVIQNIRENCTQFYVTAAEEIRKRLPVNDTFLHKLQVFKPHIALFESNRETSFIDVSFVSNSLGDYDENYLKEEWLALYHDFTVDEKQNLSELNFDNMWKKILMHQCDNMIKYPNLKSLLNAIRSLPHSNADPERTFSMLSNLKTNKRNRLCSSSINASCVFKSSLKTRGETALTMRVDERHFTLMSTKTLYAPSTKKAKSTLNLYAADDAGPS